MIRIFLLVFLAFGIACGEPLAIRVVAANLTSDNKQSYSPDNGNHSNPEGAGARILKALEPDIVMIQEFNTSVPVRQWINNVTEGLSGSHYASTVQYDSLFPNALF